MSNPTSTKDKILEFTSIVLQERGYNGFSYSHISKQLGIRNAAIHYHFPTKADLGVAMIQCYQSQFGSWLAYNELQYTHQYEKLFEAYIAISRSFIKKQNAICPLAVLEANYSVFPENMQKLTQILSKDIRSWFTQILTAGRKTSVFKFDGSPENKSILILAALHGASMMVNGEFVDIFETTVTQIKLELGLIDE
ncbi:MAG: TetR/AcrR family transcriptional regulator [Thiohalomonadales bacterium]